MWLGSHNCDLLGWPTDGVNVLATTALLSTGFNDANIGNGFVAFKVGDHCADAACTGKSPPADSSRLSDSQQTLGGLHIGGVQQPCGQCCQSAFPPRPLRQQGDEVSQQSDRAPATPSGVQRAE